jgi:inorganic pyrophosphatase
MDLLKLPAFASAETFHVVIESPKGSGLKLKYLPRWETMGISRPLPIGLVFPFDWGFVPSTRGPDGDPVDAFVMWDVSAFPGVVVICRPLGVLRIEQNASNFDRSRRVRNDRILALPVEARREAAWRTCADLPERVRDECVQFAVGAAMLDGKDLTVLGWGDPDDAVALIRAGSLVGHHG